MSIIRVFKLLLILTFILNASEHFRLYKFKSAMVYYDVKTSSFDNNLNSQVEGIARLIFTDWGLKELKEEDVSEVQSGDFNETKSHHTLTLADHGTIYTVNFDDKVIIKTRDRDLDMAITENLDLSDESVKSLIKLGANKTGKDTVAGYECDIWEYGDQKVCLHKGIPLKIIIKNAGFYSEKTAVKVIFNQDVPQKEFMLPNYKIVEDKEYSNNKASSVRTQDYITSIIELKKEMQNKGINLDDKNLTITPSLEKDIINALGKKYLEKQKKYLPSLIEAMKKAKVCIQNASTKQEAENCLKPVEDINDKLGDRTPSFDFDNLNDIKKQLAIKTLDKEIKNTEVTSKCVDKYSKTTEVITCTEGQLLPEESSTIQNKSGLTPTNENN